MSTQQDAVSLRLFVTDTIGQRRRVHLRFARTQDVTAASVRQQCGCGPQQQLYLSPVSVKEAEKVAASAAGSEVAADDAMRYSAVAQLVLRSANSDGERMIKRDEDCDILAPNSELRIAASRRATAYVSKQSTLSKAQSGKLEQVSSLKKGEGVGLADLWEDGGEGEDVKENSSTKASSTGTTSKARSKSRSKSSSRIRAVEAGTLRKSDKKPFTITSFAPVSDGKKVFTAFIVEYRDPGGSDGSEVNLLKRFTQFQELHTSLTLEFGKTACPKLPSKRKFNTKKPASVSKRLLKLEVYLNEAAKLPKSLKTPAFLQFVDATDVAPPSSQNDPSLRKRRQSHYAKPETENTPKSSTSSSSKTRSSKSSSSRTLERGSSKLSGRSSKHASSGSSSKHSSKTDKAAEPEVMEQSDSSSEEDEAVVKRREFEANKDDMEEKARRRDAKRSSRLNVLKEAAEENRRASVAIDKRTLVLDKQERRISVIQEKKRESVLMSAGGGQSDLAKALSSPAALAAALALEAEKEAAREGAQKTTSTSADAAPSVTTPPKRPERGDLKQEPISAATVDDAAKPTAPVRPPRPDDKKLPETAVLPKADAPKPKTDPVKLTEEPTKVKPKAEPAKPVEPAKPKEETPKPKEDPAKPAPKVAPKPKEEPPKPKEDPAKPAPKVAPKVTPNVTPKVNVDPATPKIGHTLPHGANVNPKSAIPKFGPKISPVISPKVSPKPVDVAPKTDATPAGVAPKPKTAPAAVAPKPSPKASPAAASGSDPKPKPTPPAKPVHIMQGTAALDDLLADLARGGDSDSDDDGPAPVAPVANVKEAMDDILSVLTTKSAPVPAEDESKDAMDDIMALLGTPDADLAAQAASVVDERGRLDVERERIREQAALLEQIIREEQEEEEVMADMIRWRDEAVHAELERYHNYRSEDWVRGVLAAEKQWRTERALKRRATLKARIEKAKSESTEVERKRCIAFQGVAEYGSAPGDRNDEEFREEESGPSCVMCGIASDPLTKCNNDCGRTIHPYCRDDQDANGCTPPGWLCMDCAGLDEEDADDACVMCGATAAGGMGKMIRCAGPSCTRTGHSQCLGVDESVYNPQWFCFDCET